MDERNSPRRPTLRSVVHDVISNLAPDDLDDLDVIIDASAANPRASARAARPRQDPTASGIDVVSAVLGDIATSLVAEAVIFVAGGFVGRFLARLRKYRVFAWIPQRGIDPDDPLPELSAEDASAVEALLVKWARARGVPEPQAQDTVAAVLDAWVLPQ